VRLSDHLVGFLQTGQVFRHKPTAAQFEHTARMLAERGVNVERGQVKDAYFATRVMPHKQQQSAITLLSIFAQHLHLVHALEHVKTLHGLLPICAWCKRVRDDKGYWSQVETYIRAHSEADFTHGICPECLERQRHELAEHNCAAGI